MSIKQEQKGICTNMQCSRGMGQDEQLISTNNSLCTECKEKLAPIIITPDDNPIVVWINNHRIIVGGLSLVLLAVVIWMLIPPPEPPPPPQPTTTKYCCKDGIRRTLVDIENNYHSRADDDRVCCEKECAGNGDTVKVYDSNDVGYANKCVADCLGVLDVSPVPKKEKKEEIDLEQGKEGINLEQAKRDAEALIDQLNDYMNAIIDKTKSKDQTDIAISSATELFIEDAEMQVSLLLPNRDALVHIYEIGAYFEHLRNLNYTDIKIEWSKINFVGSLRKSAEKDNRYEMVFTVKQGFVGYKNDKVKYSDNTTKYYMAVLEKNTSATDKTVWNILLGDTSVIATEKNE